MTLHPCPLCDDYLCTVHKVHVADCPCPPLEEWTSDPYTGEQMDLQEKRREPEPK